MSDVNPLHAEFVTAIERRCARTVRIGMAVARDTSPMHDTQAFIARGDPPLHRHIDVTDRKAALVLFDDCPVF